MRLMRKPRHDKTAKTKLAILRSAAGVFRHRGYYGATMGSIAHALRMTTPNLYYYFQSKEEILYFCHDYSLDLLLDNLKEVEKSSDAPEEKLRRLIVSFVHMVIDELRGTALTLDLRPLSPSHLRRIIAKRDRFDRGMRRVVQSGIDAKSFRATDPKLAAFGILGSLNWIPRWFDPRGSANSEQIAQVFAENLIRGLRGEKC
jgi:AcrR family transcriptional regulator